MVHGPVRPSNFERIGQSPARPITFTWVDRDHTQPITLKSCTVRPGLAHLISKTSGPGPARPVAFRNVSAWAGSARHNFQLGPGWPGPNKWHTTGPVTFQLLDQRWSVANMRCQTGTGNVYGNTRKSSKYICVLAVDWEGGGVRRSSRAPDSHVRIAEHLPLGGGGHVGTYSAGHILGKYAYLERTAGLVASSLCWVSVVWLFTAPRRG